MLSSNDSHITDEMLSAFIDNVLPENEHKFVEAAIKADAEVAWRVQSLRQTVAYLNELPELALPRSFALPANISLTESWLARQSTHQPKAAQLEVSTQDSGFWSGLRNYLQGPKGLSFNAMAAAIALALLVGGGFLYGDLLTENLRSLTNSAQVATTSQNTEIASNADANSSAGAETESDAADDSQDSSTIVQESDAAEMSTSVSVAILPTETAIAMAATQQNVEPANAEFVDPAILTPSRPLAQPTSIPLSTPLPTPDMPLAQAPAAPAAASAAASSSMANTIAPLTAQAQAVEGITDMAASSIERADADSEQFDSVEDRGEGIISSRKIDLPTDGSIANESMANESVANESMETAAENYNEFIEEYSPTAEESNMGNQASSGSLESSSVIPFNVNTPQSAPSGVAAASSSQAQAAPLTESTTPQATIPPVELPPIVIEIDESTGALTGTIQVRQDNGTMGPLAVAYIGLGQLDAMTIDENGVAKYDATQYNESAVRYTSTDNNGLFIFTSIEPGAYVLIYNVNGTQSRLNMPTDIGNDVANNVEPTPAALVIEIRAGEQIDTGVLQYEKLP